MQTGSASIQARPLRVSDLDWVVREENVLYPFPWSRGNFSDSLKAGYDAWVFSRGTPQPNGWAAADVDPIGYAVLMWIPDEMHLLNFSVLQHMQSMGNGREMLTWLIDDARRRKLCRLLLEVRPSNSRARRLYEKFGFSEVGIRKRYYPAANATREDAIVMSFEIPRLNVDTREHS